MAWVWQRFRNTFLGSPEEERHPDDVDQVSGRAFKISYTKYSFKILKFKN